LAALQQSISSHSKLYEEIEMKRLIGSTTVLALTFALALPVLAQDKPMEKTETKVETKKTTVVKPAMAATGSGVKASALSSLEDAQKKLIALAEAMPADKYTWHPEGARTVGEVFNHVSGANYFFPTRWGAKGAAGVDPRSFDKDAGDKAKTIETLKNSFDYLIAALNALPESELSKSVKVFDHDGTYLDFVLIAVTHAHEHLGQSIAYARVNGVVPPWSKKGD
jgi:uncharacterized damage-inducible protein DinB